MVNIGIIGAGQLGSRHLQALALLSFDASIQVVDPDPNSLKTAGSRFNELKKDFKGTISFHAGITELQTMLDVVIIATGSKVRKQVIEELLRHASVKFLLLEKVLFTKEEEYDSIESLLKEKNVKAWVNCPRRMMEGYKQLRKELGSAQGNIHFVVTGNNWGLGCNGIHMLDLFSFLTGTDDVELSDALIDPVISASKRPGYIEFTGTITGKSGGNSFHITSFADGSSPTQIHVHTARARYSIEEGAEGKMWVARIENNWQWEEKQFNMPFQSRLSNEVVEDLVKNGRCDLTPYAESMKLHLIFLKNLLGFMRKVKNDKTINECPIT